MLELAWWIWVLALYGLGILVAIDALWQGRTAQGTIAWFLGLLLVPFITLPLYLFLGSRRFHGYLKARRHGHQALDNIADQVLQALQHQRLPATEFTRPLYTLFRLPLTRGNRCHLLTSGADTYTALFRAIAAAEQSVCVQFYILRSDHTGQQLADLLCSKARQGVSTYLLYDEIGSSGIRRDFLQQLRQAGVQVSRFNSNRLRTRMQLNFRNHRKLAICDGRQVFVGGYNLGDEYLGDGQQQIYWRDTHLQIDGPAALTFQLSFTEDWHWATGELPRLNWQPVADCGDARVMCIASGPADEAESASLYFAHLIHNARQRCWLVSPYFVPDQNLFNALLLAGLRGLDVRILVPGDSDNWLVQQAMRGYIAQLQQCNVQFMTYQKGFLHQKVMLIDDEWSSIGSANLDNRSLRINFEINALVQDRPLARDVEQMLQQDFADARPTVISEHWWPVFLSKCARLLSPLL